MTHKSALLAAGLLLLSASVWAGEADVLDASIDPDGRGTYRVTVTVRHADTGWDHYADGWEVVAPDGTVLATRTLFHPHVDEQPFTRSLSGVDIPAEIGQVTIRAHDSVDGYGGAELVVDVPR
ncbi:MAG: hypothetical protein KDA49_02590 [Rhodospirillaceae bacterium]|nr:hypothetical protein [Rhodospirillaceae bacterium]MCA8931324.1 hypothetical protein [Rhodospirillaceae bacterium]